MPLIDDEDDYQVSIEIEMQRNSRINVAMSAYLSFQTLEDVKTVLHKPHSTANFAYDRVPWQLKIRKEVFSPAEEVRSPMAVNLIFCQV